MRVVAVYRFHQRQGDGILDYSRQLIAQLQASGMAASLERPEGFIGLMRILLAARTRSHVVVLVQYNPFSWGRWGFAPWLPASIALSRLLGPNTHIGVMVHEPYVPRTSARRFVMGTWQRLQLRWILRVASSRMASTEVFATELSRRPPHLRVFPVPVGSNLPDERQARAAERASRRIDDHFVIATMSGGHESHLRLVALDAVRAIVRDVRRPVALLLLGAGNPAPDRSVLDGVGYIESPGFLDARDLARALATADLFLAPYIDGASSRRTVLMAALQHGLPTVTTVGPGTDDLIRYSDALVTAEVADPESFARLAAELAADPDEQSLLGVRARAFYERAFDWPVIERRLIDVLVANGCSDA
jgi:glycosyltransferase involved in cell wall biosynthesis